MPRTRLCVLVTGIGGPVGRAVAEELIRRGAIVHGADDHPTALPGATAWQLPSVHESGYLPALTRLISRLDVSLVVPTVLAEMPIVAAGRAAIPPHVEIVVGGAGPVAMARDRLLTAFQLRSRGVTVPEFATPSAFTDTADALTAMGGPLVVRRRTTGGGRPAFRVGSAADLDWSTLSDDHIVQRHVSGAEFLPLVYRPGTKGVQQRVSVLRRRDPASAYQSVPEPAAADVVAVTGAEDVERVSLAAVRALGLSGPVDLIVRREAGRSPVVIDVSARFGQHLSAAPQILDAGLAAHAVFAASRSSA